MSGSVIAPLVAIPLCLPIVTDLDLHQLSQKTYAEMVCDTEYQMNEMFWHPNAKLVLLQVYRGRLKTGEEVAVKVQRPFVLETVTVDLYIIRSAVLSDLASLLAHACFHSLRAALLLRTCSQISWILSCPR